MWPSGWQLAQEKVPVVDASASLNQERPSLTSGCVGSSRRINSTSSKLAGSVTSTTETVLATALRTQAWAALPRSEVSKAIPRGTAPTAMRPSTAPLAASTVKSLSDPAAETTSVESSSLI